MNQYFRTVPINFCKRFFQTSGPKLKGHAKWQNIKHVKAANDLQRNILIMKQVKLIRLAVQDGGGSTNPAVNTTLKSAIDLALKRDVPKGTITTLLKRLSDPKNKNETKRCLFEYRLYKKLLVIVTVYTDNLPQARIQMATPVKKHLAETINAKRLFAERGVFNVIAMPNIAIENFEEYCLNDAIELGADDVEIFDAINRQVTYYCEPNDYDKVKQKLSAAGYNIDYSECEFFPQTPLVQLTDSELSDYRRFRERLLAIDGFDEIYDNFDGEID